jgi:hypothetical protein
MSADLHPTVEELYAAHGKSRRRYIKVAIVVRYGSDELKALVLSGDVSMKLALEVARFDHARQRLILAEFLTIKPRDRSRFVELVRLTRERELANGEQAQ